MQYRCSSPSDFSSLSIPSRGTVRAFSSRRCGLAYPVLRLSALECLTSLACRAPTMPSADFSSVVKVDCSTFSQFLPLAGSQGTKEISRGKTLDFHCINAGFIKRTPLADGGLNSHVPTGPTCVTPRIQFLFVAPQLRRWTSSRLHLTVTPLSFRLPSALRLPGIGTCTRRA